MRVTKLCAAVCSRVPDPPNNNPDVEVGKIYYIDKSSAWEDFYGEVYVKVYRVSLTDVACILEYVGFLNLTKFQFEFVQDNETSV